MGENLPQALAPVLLGRANTETATTSVSNAKGTALSAATSSDGDSALTGADTSRTGGAGVTGTSTNGTGVAGTTSGDGKSGVAGTDDSSGGGFAVYGTSTSGFGVYGTSTNLTGVAGESANATGASGLTYGDGQMGVHGIDASTEGGYGVYGTSRSGSGVCGTSPDGTGVVGTSTAGVGVSGVTYGDNGLGVFGGAYAGTTAVYAFGDGDNSIGVYTEAIGSRAISVFAAGDVTVTGSLSKGGGSFRIDHPLDPANKYLYHSFVESPDMMNVYNGTVVLDRDGRAVVGLADWFEALNRDYRYQLTPIGGPAPDLHIAAKVSGGQFAIAGGTAGQEVSWQVTGIRQDAWANAHRIPVEETKPAEDQGRYLHPELHHGEPITSIARVRAHAERYRQRQDRQAAP
jgi:hypothetical protein